MRLGVVESKRTPHISLIVASSVIAMATTDSHNNLEHVFTQFGRQFIGQTQNVSDRCSNRHVETSLLIDMAEVWT